MDLVLPNFELDGVTHVVTAWHAAIGQRVVEGDRLVEITAGDVTVDLPAPMSGILIERCAAMDEAVTVGQLLARIQPG
jgi:2-oxoglutarate dehydrogenase E2 component (dihydrolipoamide succinyltransferase)